MPLEPLDRNYIWDMRRFAAEAQLLVKGYSINDFEPGSMLRYAVERVMELVGEAARRVSPECQATNSQVPWRRIVGLRNVLAHEYGEINGRRLWQTVNEDIPTLVANLDEILAESEKP